MVRTERDWPAALTQEEHLLERQQLNTQPKRMTAALRKRIREAVEDAKDERFAQMPQIPASFWEERESR